MSEKWVKNEPLVNNEGIFIPVHPYSRDGEATAYQLIMTKEMFQEAYRRFIIEERNKPCQR